MFAEEEWGEGADGLAPGRVPPVRGAGGGRAEPPHDPQAPGAAERKRRQRLLATLQRLEAAAGTRPCPPADGQPAAKRPRRRRQAAGCRAEAEGRPAGNAEPGAGREAPGGGGTGPPSGATATGGTRAAAGNGTQRAPRGCGAGGRAAAERDRSGAESRRAAVPAPTVPPGVPAEPPAARPARSSEADRPGKGASAAGSAQRLTRQQWKNRQKNKRRQNKLKAGAGEEKEAGMEAGTGAAASELPALEAAPAGRSAALRARMEERLLSARFRYINQQLYTSSSQEAVKLFQDDPEAFQIYHRGFAQQVGRWPENPVDRIIRYLRRR